MDPIVVILFVGLIVIAIVMIYTRLYDGILMTDRRCREAGSALDKKLETLAELAPRLVEVVRAYAPDEASGADGVLAAVSQLNEADAPEERALAGDGLVQALDELLNAAEKHGELRANDEFYQLRGDLLSAKDEALKTRKEFAHAVELYNNAVETFPGRVIAGRRFRPRRSLG